MSDRQTDSGGKATLNDDAVRVTRMGESRQAGRQGAFSDHRTGKGKQVSQNQIISAVTNDGEDPKHEAGLNEWCRMRYIHILRHSIAKH